MQKKILCLVLTLTIVCFAESLPVRLNDLDFDNLDNDLAELGYEVEEEDLDSFSKFLDNIDTYPKTTKKDSKNSVKTKPKVSSSGFQKKGALKQDVKGKYNVGDLEKFLKTASLHEHGQYDDNDEYHQAKAVVAAAAGTSGKEKRTYNKGTKTKGFHQVHHKDEYKKDQEFFEEDQTSGTVNKNGGKVVGVKVGSGAGFKIGELNHERQKGFFAKQGYSDAGFADKDYDGFFDSQGLEGSYSNES